MIPQPSWPAAKPLEHKDETRFIVKFWMNGVVAHTDPLHPAVAAGLFKSLKETNCNPLIVPA